MTTTEIIVLIGLILMAAFFQTGYYYGRKEGRTDGMAAGRKLGRDGAQQRVQQLQDDLDATRREYARLDSQCRLAQANAKLGADERQTLLQIAGKLQVSAATFGAINAKAHQQQTLQLRDKTLALAELVQPQALERAA